jgi:tetratricopeptide (TPR) repeat protein
MRFRALLFLCAAVLVSWLPRFVPQSIGQTTHGAGAEAHENPHQADPQQELWRLRNEGVAHFESGVGLKKALAAFQAALTLSPGSAVELVNVGVTQRKLGNLDDAMQTLLLANRADKGLPHPYYTLGLIYRNRGDLKAAEQSFQEARRLAPAQAASYFQLGRLYREGGRSSEALQAFVDTLRLNPGHTGALYQLHLYYQEHGAAEEAKRSFEEFSRVKRALSSSRRESNDDESELSRPIAGNRGASGVATGPVTFARAAAVLAQDVAAFDINDIDGDGLQDVVVADHSGAIRVLKNKGGGQFTPLQTAQLPGQSPVKNISLQILSRGEAFRIIVGRQDGVYVSDADPNSNGRTFVKVTSTDASSGLSFADIDHDGDVDIIVGAFQEVLINEGNATLEAHQLLDTETGRSLHDAVGAVTFAGFEAEDALDAVVLRARGGPGLLEDTLGGRYILQKTSPFASAAAAQWTDAADMDGDGRTDLVTVADTGLAVYYNAGQRRFKRSAVGAGMQLGQSWVAATGDFDNDGRPDIVILGAQQGSLLWRNVDGSRFTAESLPWSIRPDQNARPHVVDLDNDGRLDLVALQRSGELAWLRNTSANAGGLMTVVLKGLRSAPSGLHTQVEVRRGTFYAKTVATGGPVQIGLGAGSYAEVVRITWPDGFVENKFKVDTAKVWTFTESERVSGSCPSVFAWDGRRFKFISDAFISGPMGVPMGPGNYFPPDHDEYLRIPGSELQSDQGRLRVAITEELREAVYLDQVKLLAVDHPAAAEVYPNEYLMPGEFPSFKLHVSTGAHPPLAARDQAGADVLDLIRNADQRYPANFRRLPYDGFAEPQGVEFLLPETAAASASLRLFLTGWFYYFESSSLIAASQRSDLKMIWPRIEAWEDGRWRLVRSIGLPSGVDKTVVVDLTGKLPAQTQRLRIWTNLALYWDRIAIDTTAAPEAAVRVQTPALRNATLAFRGFSGFLPADTHFPQPERFDYDTLRYVVPWNPLAGMYTRYGDVRPLLGHEDSQFAVFGSGDALQLEFDGRGLQPPPAGWKRDYLLYLNGYVKDGDRYTAHPGRLDPLPFTGMKHYPYSSAEARSAPWHSAAYKKYLREYQTRSPMQFTGSVRALRSGEQSLP